MVSSPDQIIDTISNHTSDTSSQTFDWSQETQGVILSSFFIGYTISLFCGGYFVEKFGGKWILCIGILTSAITSLLTPPLVEIGGATALVILRIINGLGQGTIFPASGVLIANWIPKEERSLIGSIVMGAGQFGGVVGNILSALLLELLEWSYVFYLFGTICILWCIFFSFSCYNDPKSHPKITENEKNVIAKSLGQLECKEHSSVPWKELWTSGPFMALLVAQIGHDWGFSVVVLNLPKYLNDVLKLTIETNGLITSSGFLMMWIVSLIVGYLSDWLIKLDYMKLTNVRKFFGSVSSIGFGFFMLLASYAGLDHAVVVPFILLAYAIMGAFFPSIRVNAIDLAPNYAGTLIAITNGLGAIAAFIGPYLAGVLTPNAALEEWRVVLWISFMVLTLSSVVYCIWCSAEQQVWNDKETVSVADKTLSAK